MSTFTACTRLHGESPDQGKQGAQRGARGARSQGCTGDTLSIERAPVPQAALGGLQSLVGKDSYKNHQAVI